MEGQEFLAINPDTLNDSTMWSYRDLQKLSKAVSLRANLKRSILVKNLQYWHRLRIDGTKTIVEDSHTENIDMNVVGNNFSIFAINVKSALDSDAKHKRGRKSIIGIGLETGVVSPTLLRPLRPEPATPGKSCLKRKNLCSSSSDDESETAITCTPNKKRLANICFSPFNGVKVIAHREESFCIEDSFDSY